jgi:hypothetical protein
MAKLQPRSLNNWLLPQLRPRRQLPLFFPYSLPCFGGFSAAIAAASSFANGGGNNLPLSNDNNDANTEAIRKSKRWLEEFTADKIPRREFEVSYARSSGPGGQNVNKGKKRCPPPLNFLAIQKLQPLEIPLSFLRTLLMFQYLDQA